MRILTLSLMVACAGASLPAAAQTTLKPGLWEMQHRTSAKAEASTDMQKQMAALPPEQRKQMEAMMAGRGGAMAPGDDGGMTMKVCLTKEMVERNDITASRGECKTTQQQRTGNTLKMAFTCTRPPSKGDTQVTFNSPESFTTHTNVTTTAPGKSESMSVEGGGKWVSADCGSVQPIQ
ncbi:MAG TPA: DUF3617 domain-containing protein, partial [Ramlibacter sp.]